MTGSAPQALTYATLDDLGEQVAASVIAVWVLRTDMPLEEWVALVVATLSTGILQAEAWGRAYGRLAEPVDGEAILPPEALTIAPDPLPEEEPEEEPEVDDDEDDDEDPEEPDEEEPEEQEPEEPEEEPEERRPVRRPVRRPPPANFEQRSSTAPEPDEEIDVDERLDELEERLTKAVRTLQDEIDALGDEITEEEPEDEEQDRDPVREPLRYAPRLERLAWDEAVQATQRGYQDGIRLQEPAVTITDQDGNVYEDVGQDNAGERPEVDERGRQRPRTSSESIRGYRRGINPDACELCFWLWAEGRVYAIDQPMHRHTGCRCIPVPTTDPVGRWSMTVEERALLDDMYEKYVR